MTNTIPPEYLNQIVTGDALDLVKRIPDASIDLIVADGPYYKISPEDWDNVWASVDDYADWYFEVGREMVRCLKQTGSAFVFGDEKNIAYVQVRLDKLPWRLLNNIVWSKTNYTALKAAPDMMRSYRPQGEERILFYAKDLSFPSFSEVRNPIAAKPMAQYMREERERSGISAKEIAALFPSKTGGLTGCVSNWELGLNFPTKEQYETIRDYLNKSGRYEYMRREYEDMRREYEDMRRPFFGGERTDVWCGPLINGDKKLHPCHKPEWIVKQMILDTTRPGDTILDLFAGSGEVCKWAKQYGYKYIAFESDAGTAERSRERLCTVQPPLLVMQYEPVEVVLQPEQAEMRFSED